MNVLKLAFTILFTLVLLDYLKQVKEIIFAMDPSLERCKEVLM